VASAVEADLLANLEALREPELAAVDAAEPLAFPVVDAMDGREGRGSGGGRARVHSAVVETREGGARTDGDGDGGRGRDDGTDAHRRPSSQPSSMCVSSRLSAASNPASTSASSPMVVDAPARLGSDA
jgi:hypothetical protein